MNRKVFFFLLLLTLVDAAASTSTITTSEFLTPTMNDQSIKYLGMIFGQVGNVLTNAFPSTLMTKIFTIYNYGFLTFSVIILSYTFSFNIVNDITTGQPLANTYDVTTVGRILLGNTFLLPTYGGYSLIQVMYMQIVVLGVGLGDNLWSGIIENIPISGIVAAQTINPSGSNSFVNQKVLGEAVAREQSSGADATIINLFAMTICGQAQYRHDKSAANGQTISPTDYQWLCQDDQCFIGKRSTDAGGQTSADCGKIKLKNGLCSGNDNDSEECLSGAEYTTAVSSINSILTALWPYTESWFNNMIQQTGTITVADMIQYPKTGTDPGDIASYLGDVALNYYYSLEPLSYTTTNAVSSNYYTMSDSSSAGWISASRYIGNPPENVTETTSTTSFDEGKFDGMMYKVVEFIPTFTPNECSSSVCFVSDTYYQKIALPQNNTSYLWTNNFSDDESENSGKYISITGTYITNYFDSREANSTAPSAEDEQANVYLDSAVSILYNYWLKFGKGAGPYADFNLDLESSVSKFSLSPNKVDIGIYQRNLYVLLNRILEDVTGLKYFSDDNSQSYGSVSQNSAITNLDAKCSNVQKPTGCFSALLSNESALVQPGVGFIGTAVALKNNNVVNPLASVQYMGLQMLNHSLGNMTQTVSDVMDLNEELSLAYFETMMAIQGLYLPIYALNAFVFQFTMVGPYIDQVVGGAVDAVIKMITFYQRLDYVFVSLYQPLAATLAQIMVSVGFIIGV